MARKKVEEIVSELALPITEKHSFELVDVEFVKEGANWYLRIYIDKPGGITIDDCQVISEEISDKMDETDPISQSYFLEVSSPGLERPLKKDSDFEKFKGEQVEVKLFQPLDGKKVFEGELVGLVDGQIVIKQGNAENINFDRDKISIVRRVIKF
ncbi:MAG: ribosome maturation factor RimP [Clostridia bacterium]|nr:ribosome maturation factor RimP [Clostridia bacterium]